MNSPDLRKSLLTLVTIVTIGFAYASGQGLVNAVMSGQAASQGEGIEEDLPTQTKKLKDLIEDYQRAPEATKGEVLDSARRAAKERKKKFAATIQANPAEAITSKLPDTLREGLPSDISAELEQEVNIEGPLEVLHLDNFETNTSRKEHAIESKDGKRISLYFTDSSSLPPPRSRVRLKAILLDDQAAVDSAGLSVVSEPLPPPATKRKVAVILFNFQDNTIQPWSLDTIRDVLTLDARSIDAYYREISFNKLGFEGKLDPAGDVFGWFTIPYTLTPCSYNTWYNSVRSLAAAAGADLTGYDTIIYAFPFSGACNWSGMADLGGPTIMINGTFSLPAVGHELGHTLGLLHANAYSCKDPTGKRVSISTNCTSKEYGDPFDIMSSGPARHTNNYHKSKLIWVEPANIQKVLRSGMYDIAPLERPSSGVQTLQLLAVPGTRPKYYYLEYRQPFGFDAFNTADPVVNGVSIRLAPDYTKTDPSLLIDATPETTSFLDAPLLVGRSFIDTRAGVMVKTFSKTAEKATVQIVLSKDCLHVNPSLSISPQNQAAIFPTQVLAYTLTLSNNDDPGTCLPSTFIITPALPSGWKQITPTPEVFLDPGTSTTTIVHIVSSADAKTSTYSFTETLTNRDAPVFFASGTAQYGLFPGTSFSFTDDFNRPNASLLDNSWLEVEGDLVITENRLTHASAKGSHRAILTGLEGVNQSAAADFIANTLDGKPRFGIIFRYQDPKNYYVVYRQSDGSLRIAKIINGIETILKKTSFPSPKRNVPFRVSGRAEGNRLAISIDGVEKLSVTDSTFGSGKTGIVLGSNSNALYWADNFSITIQR